MSTPTALKHHGQHQSEAAADFRIVQLVDQAIAEANASGREWDCNLIRAQFPTVRNGLVGARVDAARKRGEMVAVDRTRSTLLSTRSAWITVWRGAR